MHETLPDGRVRTRIEHTQSIRLDRTCTPGMLAEMLSMVAGQMHAQRVDFDGYDCRDVAGVWELVARGHSWRIADEVK